MPDVRDLKLNKVKLLTSVSSKRGTGNLTSKQMSERAVFQKRAENTHTHTHTSMVRAGQRLVW